jgi:hypothetical protein
MLVSMPLNTKTVFKPPRYGYTEGAVCSLSHSEGYSCDRALPGKVSHFVLD